jgi:hypothetical protein
MTKQFPKHLTTLVAGALFLSVVLGCGLTGKLFDKKSMFEGTTAQDAGEAFKKKLGGPVKALSLELEKDVAVLKAQDPNKPQNVDEYKYVKGIVLGPTPVQLNVLERNLDGTLFNLDEINLAATEALAKEAVKSTAVEGGRVTKMMIERGLSLDAGMTKAGTIRWEVTVEGTRENASATANVKGEIVGVDISQTARAANWSAFKEETLTEAVPRIKQAFGGNIKMFEITIYDKYVMFKAISPRDKEVTTYKYDFNGVTSSQLHNIGDPTPISVAMSRKYKLEDFLFDLDAVKLEMAPSLGKKALERLGFSSGRVVLYKIETNEDPFARKNDLVTQWTVSCQQGRKSGMVMYDLAGNEIKVLPQR